MWWASTGGGWASLPMPRPGPSLGPCYVASYLALDKRGSLTYLMEQRYRLQPSGNKRLAYNLDYKTKEKRQWMRSSA